MGVNASKYVEEVRPPYWQAVYKSMSFEQLLAVDLSRYVLREFAERARFILAELRIKGPRS